ncbi:DUF2268 domain-containing putative Zn-dependent protease [Tamlana flava]|uniref:DUF2268 domain-containing putative Zn-dependent protease n=1 Tax=Tamlana flava TaxID=3158572 RepID=UPI00351B6392
MIFNHISKALFAFCFLALFNCSSKSQETADSKIDLGFNSFLYFENNNAFDSQKSTIETKVKEAVSVVNAKMPTENINIKIRASATNVIPEIDIGGFNPNANEVIVSINPNFANLNQSISNELGPTIAHEMHHAKRRRSVGYGSSLLQAMVTEGLADSFSVEIFGIAPPIWCTALSTSDLEYWKETASSIWNDTTYNHDEWFFGVSNDIPRWTGYSVGFKLAQDYLEQNPSLRASDVVDEPASSFVE